MKKTLKVATSPNEDMSFTNRIYFNPVDYPDFNHCYFRLGRKLPHIFYGESSPLVVAGTIGMNKIQRLSSGCSLRRTAEVEVFEPSRTEAIHANLVSLTAKYKNERGGCPRVDGEEFVEMVLSNLNRHIVVIGQEIPFFWAEKLLVVKVVQIDVYDVSDLAGPPPENIILTPGAGSQSVTVDGKPVGIGHGRQRFPEEEVGEDEDEDDPSSSSAPLGKRKSVQLGMIIKDTNLKLKSAQGSKLIFENLPSSAAEGLFKGTASFRDLGIGGLDRQLKAIFRRAFASRIYPKEVIQKFGIQHVKGVLLHGPPGTGKTLTARQIGKMLNTHEPIIVNGPEILNKYVGESEANIRKLFQAAEEEFAEKGDESQLYLIIFDEIDAICKSRGTTRSGTGVNDSVVNQLLSKIDGVNALNNILIIGMTNRLDLIDEALLRSGRFEIKMEIGLPDEEGRHQIFEIHTAEMVKNDVLDSDVNLMELASRTDNYSGAEIAGVVRSAVAFALNKHIHFDDLERTYQNLPKMANRIKVRMLDFEKALEEVRPSYGVAEDEFEVYLDQPLIPYGRKFVNLEQTIVSFMSQLRASRRQNMLSLLLEGERGAGKTSLAVHLACRRSEFPFIKMVSPQQMIGFTPLAKCNHLVHVFELAYKSQESIVIIDDIERMIEYIEMGPHFSNQVLQALLVIIKKPPPPGRKLLIIGTTSLKENLQDLSIIDAFNIVLNVPMLEKDHPEEIRSVLTATANFVEGEIDSIIENLPDRVPIKHLLLIIEMASANVPKGEPISLSAFLQAMVDCGVK